MVSRWTACGQPSRSCLGAAYVPGVVQDDQHPAVRECGAQALDAGGECGQVCQLDMGGGRPLVEDRGGVGRGAEAAPEDAAGEVGLDAGVVGEGDGEGGLAGAGQAVGGEGGAAAGEQAGDQVVEQGVTADEGLAGLGGDVDPQPPAGPD